MDGKLRPPRVPQKPGVWQGGHGEGKRRATSLVGSPQRSLYPSQGKAGLSSGGSNHRAAVTPLALEPAGEGPRPKMCTSAGGDTQAIVPRPAG